MIWPDNYINQIIQGDCLDVMKGMPDGCVDLIITSPPYNCRKKYIVITDELPWAKYYEWMEQILDEFYRLLTIGGVLAINVPGVVRWQADHKYANTWTDYDSIYRTHRNGKIIKGKGRIEPLGFNLFSMMQKRDSHIREPIVWVKGNEKNAFNSEYKMGCDSDPYLRPSHEWILLGSKGRWYHRGGTGRRGREAMPFLEETKDTWFISPQSSRIHPAIYPIELPLRLIKLFTHISDAIVFDPFVGSGTTAVAAITTGRSFIGIDLNPEYCDMAERRLAEKKGD